MDMEAIPAGGYSSGNKRGPFPWEAQQSILWDQRFLSSLFFFGIKKIHHCKSGFDLGESHDRHL